jgi:hypothetical protein
MSQDYYFCKKFALPSPKQEACSNDKSQVLRAKNKRNKPDQSHDTIVTPPSFNRN